MNVTEIVQPGQQRGSSYYIYVDNTNHMADELFTNNNIKVKFIEVEENKKSDFILVHCSINKKDADKFEEVMNELDAKLQELYKSSYTLFCKRFASNLNKLAEEGNKDE